MILMNGKKLSEKISADLLKRVNNLSKKPHIVFVQIGENASSTIYLKHKKNMCEKLGITSSLIKLKSETTFDEIKKNIERLNVDDAVDGILVQFPLPKDISKRKVSALIAPEKDADGVHPLNQGYMLTKTNTYSTMPCTPKGIIKLLEEYKIPLKGKHAVVIGRSNIAGRPMSNMLINKDMTVSLIHSLSSDKDKTRLLKDADLIITATGHKNIFSPNDVKKDVVIVDVGIIKENNKIRGDIEYKKFDGTASYVTPVPNGVGPMTVIMLMENIIILKEIKEGKYE